MSRGGKTLIAILIVFVLVLDAKALAPDVSESPYQAIVERNVFGLRPPPVIDTNTPPPQPAAKITLTGITTILGKTQALMSVQTAGKPQPEFFMLTEGQRAGEIEVLEINETAGTVKVTNQGVAQVLDFKSDGAKLQAALPGIPPPGSPGLPGIPPPPGNPATRTIPTRTLRLPLPQAGGNPASPGAGHSPVPAIPPPPQ
jgi:hypothetical protein